MEQPGPDREEAHRLLELWLDRFSRNQVVPTSGQLVRLHALLRESATWLPEQTAQLIAFSITSVAR
jgi:hypothetical protein